MPGTARPPSLLLRLLPTLLFCPSPDPLKERPKMRLSLLLPFAAALLSVSPVAAAELAKPTGKVILEVTGKIANTNDGTAADFDMQMLDALASRTTVTATPWYDSAKSFAGPTGKALLDAVGASGETLRVTALNDYVTEIPLSDFKDYPVILATTLDGEPMSVRDKGPIFVIYPFDEQPDLNNETYYGRSAWQVKSIEVF